MMKCGVCGRHYGTSWGRSSITESVWHQVASAFLSGQPLSEALKATGLSRQQYLRATKDIKQSIYNELIYGGDKVCPKNKLYCLLSFRLVTRSGKEAFAHAIVYSYYDIGNYKDTKRFVLAPENHFTVQEHLGGQGEIVYPVDQIDAPNRQKSQLSVTLHPIHPNLNSRSARLKFFYYRRLKSILEKILLSRKGVSPENFPLFVAELIWKHRYHHMSSNTKISYLKETMLRNKAKLFSTL